MSVFLVPEKDKYIHISNFLHKRQTTVSCGRMVALVLVISKQDSWIEHITKLRTHLQVVKAVSTFFKKVKFQKTLN